MLDILVHHRILQVAERVRRIVVSLEELKRDLSSCRGSLPWLIQCIDSGALVHSRPYFVADEGSENDQEDGPLDVVHQG